LADYAAILADLNRGAERSAVVVFGGSYGGATGIDFLWFSDAREVSGSFFKNLGFFQMFLSPMVLVGFPGFA